MKSSEFIKEAFVGQSSPITPQGKRRNPREQAKKKVEDLISEGPFWDKTKNIAGSAAIGGALALGSVGMPTNAVAAPYEHYQDIDRMTGENRGSYSTVDGEDGRSFILINWSRQSVIISIPRTIQPGYPDINGRIRLGSSPVEHVKLRVLPGGKHSAATIEGNSTLISRLMTFSGELKVEVPTYSYGDVIYRFIIEPDKTTAQLAKRR